MPRTALPANRCLHHLSDPAIVAYGWNVLPPRDGSAGRCCSRGITLVACALVAVLRTLRRGDIQPALTWGNIIAAPHQTQIAASPPVRSAVLRMRVAEQSGDQPTWGATKGHFTGRQLRNSL